MKIWARLSLLSFFVLATAARAASAAEQGWLFDQNTQTLGKMTLYYEVNKAIRIDVERTKSTLVMKSPDWRVQLFHKSRGLSFTSEADSFDEQFHATSAAMVSTLRSGIKVKFKNDGVFAGIPAKVYGYQSTKEQTEETLIKSADYTVCTLPIPSKAAHVVQKLYNVPFIDALPLAFFIKSPNDRDYRELNTFYAKKKTLDSTTFDVPTGYKPYKKLMDYWSASLGTDDGGRGLFEMIEPAQTKTFGRQQ